MPNPLQLVPNDLKAAIQQAIEVELSTIPIYLYTYYSINRVPNQQDMIVSLTKRYEREGLSPAEAAKKAQDVSVQVMVHANKAGAIIMSVAVEEMLHMGLACNLKRALVGMPKLVGKSPAKYPAQLRGHVPGLSIPLRRFGLAQLDIFKQIELPAKPAKKLLTAEPEEPTQEWTSLADLYGWVSKQITSNVTPVDFTKFADCPQLEPNRDYYATNNVNTLYYDKDHKPKFVNNDVKPGNPHSGGDLIRIVDVKTALAAIDLIVEQGEGHEDEPAPQATANRPWKGHAHAEAGEQAGEDPTQAENEDDDAEKSHYKKYCELRDELAEMIGEKDGSPNAYMLDYFVKQVPDNPTTASYPADVQTMSNLINAVYTYLFMMTEACYLHDVPKQREIFNFGMHKGMIFILSTLCDQMTYTKLPGGGVAAPTFENYVFRSDSSPKAQLLELYHAMPASVNPNPNVLARMKTLPDMANVTERVLSFA
ncbi:ferritin-like protein [Hymenobacter lucidus]|uniref:Ferritin-like protein n=1 Tax=Hymenobacter lucidus TaxID=2880930 RepID=A0ABS8APC4_9BACT|nr:ferritin-like protein [Hymenobacter lucidus]MCB2407478.1 ferritin-like protein [Hymenobacter lucidus]